jgi:hypothetical protein
LLGQCFNATRYFSVYDKFENMGAQIVREVASKTSALAGDGTTTATVLAQAIVKEGAKSVAAGQGYCNDTANFHNAPPIGGRRLQLG